MSHAFGNSFLNGFRMISAVRVWLISLQNTLTSLGLNELGERAQALPKTAPKLAFNPGVGAFDLLVDDADLRQEATLASAVLLSLTCDRLAQPHEVAKGEDRRGWWADAYSAKQDQFGSRLWLLAREKQTPATVQRCKTYIEEALQWMIDDELIVSMAVSVFVPKVGRMVAIVKLVLNGDSRDFRFEWNDVAQVWQLASNAV
ncbi:MAG: phage GP46 family protein [Polaromonas sp.]